MALGKNKRENHRKFVGIEKGLQEANRKFIKINKYNMEMKKELAEEIVYHIVNLMRRESPNFDFLFEDVFCGGSSFEGLKIDKPDEFDVDILFRLPEIIKPILIVSNIPGHVHLKLLEFQKLEIEDPDLYTEMKCFVDKKNYLRSKEWKNYFIRSIFDRTLKNIPDNIIMIRKRQFRITNVQNMGPALTLTMEDFRQFNFSIDLVPSIIFDKNQWPGGDFERNSFTKPSDFYIVPKSPKGNSPYLERYWRLSFQKQEKEIIVDSNHLKPAIRVLKRIRDHFGHKISSYAIKTMFLEKFKTDDTELWLSPFSHCVVYMLQEYAECLEKGKIPYFWNKKMNLIEDLSTKQTTIYKNHIRDMLKDIESNPLPRTILKYLVC